MNKLIQASFNFVMEIPRLTTTQVYSFQEAEMDDDWAEIMRLCMISHL